MTSRKIIYKDIENILYEMYTNILDNRSEYEMFKKLNYYIVNNNIGGGLVIENGKKKYSVALRISLSKFFKNKKIKKIANYNKFVKDKKLLVTEKKIYKFVLFLEEIYITFFSNN